MAPTPGEKAIVATCHFSFGPNFDLCLPESQAYWNGSPVFFYACDYLVVLTILRFAGDTSHEAQRYLL
jgi:hypothetical protein